MDKTRLKELYQLKDYWEERVIKKEKVLALYQDFYTDEEMQQQFAKLEEYRTNLDNIINEINYITQNENKHEEELE